MTEQKMLQLLPGWEIVRVIGKGSFGKVYEIQKRDAFGQVSRSALKVISIPGSNSEIAGFRDDGFDDESITAMFKSRAEDLSAECRLMSELKGNSNIVSYEEHYLVPQEDQPGWDILIRMELVTPLPEFYQARYPTGEVRQDDKTVVQLGIDICKALELCAKHKIIHRDIKPQNIFINNNGDFKLGDFGVARTLDHTTQATKIGTYGYMAPEIYQGKPYDFSVDIYSTGIILYWMLNKRTGPFLPLGSGSKPVPYTPSQKTAALEKRMNGVELPPPLQASPAMKAVIAKACAYDPADRFRSPTEMREALEYAAQNPFLADEKTVMVLQPKPKYLVQFFNEDGAILARKEYEAGATLILPLTPRKPEDDQFSYVFEGWSPEPERVVERAVDHVARYRAVPLPTGAEVEKPEKSPGKRFHKWRLLFAIPVAAVLLLLVFLLGPFGENGGEASDPGGSATSGPEAGDPGASDTGAAGSADDPSPDIEAPIWSEWQETLPSDLDAEHIIIEVQTQYRSAPACYFSEAQMPGYTFCYSVYGDWGEWSAWTTTAISEREGVEVETRTMYQYRTGYYRDVSYGLTTRRELVVSNWMYSETPVYVGGNVVNVSTFLQYRSRERSMSNCFVEDGTWSEFDRKVILPTEDIVVSARTVYRYAEVADGTVADTSPGMSNFTFSPTNYSGRFLDVDDSLWYGGASSCIGVAVDLGAMDTDEYLRFRPEDSAAIYEVIKAAAVIHQTYYANPAIIIHGADDYMPYVDYAIEHGLIMAQSFSDYTAAVTREQAAYILWHVLPAEELRGLNQVTAITDMDPNSLYYTAVYQMAEAGIISWPAPEYAFSPKNSLKRSELAAFVDRLVKPENRVSSN